MADIPTIEPFQFIRSTAFSERVQLANKLNEVIDVVNSIGDLPDLESQITEINSKISELEESIGSTDTSLADLENQVNALVSEVNTTIKQSISALESEVEGIDTRLTTAEGTISEHGTEIDGLLKEVIDGVAMMSNPHGTIQVQINHEDGSNDISAPIDLGLVEQGGIILQSGTTDRSFKLIVNLTDGTSWQTNDFVIPEGGGTEVSVTNISIALGTASNMIQVKVGLSDGSTISSNDWTVVTPAEFSALGTRVTTAEGNITKNTGDISDLETRVQAIEDSPGFTLQPATATRLGGVKIGSGITVQSDGTIAVDKTQINTAAVASTVMFTADASKVTLHADSVAGSEFTEDIPQASQGGAGTIDQASYAKIAATEAKVNALAPTVTVNDDVLPAQITVAINGKESSANLPSTTSLFRVTQDITNEPEFEGFTLLDLTTANASEYFTCEQEESSPNSASVSCIKDFAVCTGGDRGNPGIIFKAGFKVKIRKVAYTMDNFLMYALPSQIDGPALDYETITFLQPIVSFAINYQDTSKFSSINVLAFYFSMTTTGSAGQMSIILHKNPCQPITSKETITSDEFKWNKYAFLG